MSTRAVLLPCLVVAASACAPGPRGTTGGPDRLSVADGAPWDYGAPFVLTTSIEKASK